MPNPENVIKPKATPSNEQYKEHTKEAMTNPNAIGKTSRNWSCGNA